MQILSPVEYTNLVFKTLGGKTSKNYGYTVKTPNDYGYTRILAILYW
jgi:hypothetical protein